MTDANHTPAPMPWVDPNAALDAARWDLDYARRINDAAGVAVAECNIRYWQAILSQ